MNEENSEIREKFWELGPVEGGEEGESRVMCLRVVFLVPDLSIMKVLIRERLGEWKLARILWIESTLGPRPIVNELGWMKIQNLSLGEPVWAA